MNAQATARRESCIGSGQCVFSAPEVFDQDDDGWVEVIGAPDTAEQLAAVNEAIQNCPGRALSLTEV